VQLHVCACALRVPAREAAPSGALTVRHGQRDVRRAATRRDICPMWYPTDDGKREIVWEMSSSPQVA
jgi:hypothetical protein